jgi:hypothetical protein
MIHLNATLLPLAFAGGDMGRSGSSKRARHIAAFPDEIMDIVFSKLCFHDKIYAGLVCKQWDQLLKAGTAAARHWDVDYRVTRIVQSPKGYRQVTLDHPIASIGRCAICAGLFSHMKFLK